MSATTIYDSKDMYHCQLRGKYDLSLWPIFLRVTVQLVNSDKCSYFLN